MGQRLSSIWKYIDNATTPATSRWGFVNTLLAVSAIFIAIGAWRTMNWLVVLGLVIGVSAIIMAIIWLIKGSKDPTATKDDIDKLGDVIKKESKELNKGIAMLNKTIEDMSTKLDKLLK